MRARLVLPLLLVLALPGSAVAAAWLPPEFVGDDAKALPVLAVAPSGAPVAAYVTSANKVAVVTRKPGGSYERTDVVPEVDTNPELSVVGVGADAAGGVAVAYLRSDGSPGAGGTAFVASRPGGAATFADRTLAGGAPLGSAGSPPVFTVLPDGTMFLARSSDVGVWIDQGPIGGTLTRTEVGPGIAEDRGPLALATNAAGEVLVALATARIDGLPAVPSNTKIPELNLLRRSATGELSASRVKVDETAAASTQPPNSVTPLTTSAALAPDGSADVEWGYRTNGSETGLSTIRAVHLPAGSTTTDTPDAARAIGTVATGRTTPGILSPPVAVRSLAGDGATIAYSVIRGGMDNGNGRVYVSSRFSSPSYAPATEIGPPLVGRTLFGAVPSGTAFELLFADPPGALTGRSRAFDEEYGALETIAPASPGVTVSSRASASGVRDGAVTTLASNPVQFAQIQVHDATPPMLDLSGIAATRVGVATAVPSGVGDSVDGAPVVSWDFGDGTSGSGAAPAHTWGAPGSYVVKATATDASGNAANAEKQVVVGSALVPLGPGIGPTGPAGPTTPVSDHVAPKLGAPKLSPATVKRAKPTTTLTLSVSEPATLVATVTTKRPGAKRGKVCRATAKRVAKTSRCTATVTVLRKSAKLTTSAKATLKLTLKAKPAKGSYVVRLVATDVSGNDSTARTVTLRVR